MSESAGTGLRDRRRAETRAALTRNARRLTAAKGFTGFTVEQLCESVGVSRRTFFNYFRSKEDALIGHVPDAFDESAVEAFLAGGRQRAGRLSSTLLDDLTTLMIEQVERIGSTPEEVASILAALDREPELLRSLIQSAIAQESFLVGLVEQREGLPVGDQRARAAVLVVGGLTRSSCERFFSPVNDTPFHVLVRSALAAAREVFTTDPS